MVVNIFTKIIFYIIINLTLFLEKDYDRLPLSENSLFTVQLGKQQINGLSGLHDGTHQ